VTNTQGFLQQPRLKLGKKMGRGGQAWQRARSNCPRDANIGANETQHSESKQACLELEAFSYEESDAVVHFW